MRLCELVEVSAQLQATASRREKVERLSAWLRRLAPSDAPIGVAYLSGGLRQGRVGVGGAALASARDVVAADRPSLLLRDIDACFAEIETLAGPGSGAARERRLAALFAQASAAEQDFLLRLITGELRQGALHGVMLEAVAHAAGVATGEVRHAFMVEGDLGVVAQAALSGGTSALARFSLRPLQPVRPMLAQPAPDVDEVLERLGTAAFEYKLDGARVQAHKGGREIRVYSRTLQDVTGSLPELVDVVERVPASELILDGEAIALAANGRPLPFQDTMRRFGRKQDVAQSRAALPLSVFFFDCLHAAGDDLIALPAAERFRVLNRLVPPQHIVPRRITGDAAEASAFLGESLARGHEGLVAKALDAPYAAGNRGGDWLKIKSAQTLDLVVLAAEWGHGRRRGFLSNLHLGARAATTDEYVMLGKTFKGMTDRMLAWQTERLLALQTSRDRRAVYVRPALVVEIAFNGLQASAQYPGGLALRFARVKRYREDKTPAEADSMQTVRALYERQGGDGTRD